MPPEDRTENFDQIHSMGKKNTKYLKFSQAELLWLTELLVSTTKNSQPSHSGTVKQTKP